mmetsp:Transcript_63892/g.161056  ORF Transcript_63892/g.161056 Transcript_63892/m.161056 type:complete len:173 (-) Transcript_63892:639-1157(-)
MIRQQNLEQSVYNKFDKILQSMNALSTSVGAAMAAMQSTVEATVNATLDKRLQPIEQHHVELNDRLAKSAATVLQPSKRLEEVASRPASGPVAVAADPSFAASSAAAAGASSSGAFPFALRSNAATAGSSSARGRPSSIASVGGFPVDTNHRDYPQTDHKEPRQLRCRSLGT